MDTIWVGIDPRSDRTRILAVAGPEQTLVKAQLCPSPSSRLALGALLEAIALWQGKQVHAALVVGGPDSSGSTLTREAFAEFGNGLYTLDYVAALRRPRRRDPVSGLGDFRDLRQMLLFEALR